MRMVPYRTTDNVIDGLVMTFVDITDQKRAFAELQRVEDELHHTWVCNPFLGVKATSMLGMRIDEFSTGEGTQQLLELQRRVLSSGAGEQRDIALVFGGEAHTWRVCAHPPTRRRKPTHRCVHAGDRPQPNVMSC